MLISSALTLSLAGLSTARTLVEGRDSNATTDVTSSSTNLRSVLAQHLNPKCSGTQVLFPNSANWTTLTPRWSTYEAPTYQAAVRPSCVEDVVATVKVATAFNIPFLTTGGGHGISVNFGKLQNGLQLDMSAFKQIEINKTANTMTVGGAVVFGEVYEPLWAAGKEIATGSCECVGFVGGSMGGGVGRYQGIHGLIIDSLVSVNLITAAGQQLTLSATQNQELFWGYRGAGMNFGVVTSATYKITDPTNSGQVQDADLVFKASTNESYFHLLESLSGKLPAQLSLLTYIYYNATGDGIEIILNAVYPGPVDTFMTLLKPFLDLKPITQVIHTLPWNNLLTESGFGFDKAVCATGNQHDIYAVTSKDLSAATYIDAFDKYNALFLAHPDTQGSVLEIEFFSNQAVVAVADGATAYPFRDAQVQNMIEMAFTGDKTSAGAQAADSLARELRDSFAKTSGYSQLSVYVSYAHGDETPESYYGEEKLPRLVALKKKYDPHNFFSFDNGIPLKWP